MSTPDTFLELVKRYRVEIPLLQRDYAQGRSEEEDKKAPGVRVQFVKELFRALIEEKPLELDFIYGPITETRFVPLDGQQRLTTLFLLHWYLAKREGKDCPNLKNLTYKVRTTTQEFLSALLQHDEVVSKSPKTEIMDAKWYYSAWDTDPSVQGMLNMLDAIHAEYEKKQGLFWDRLGYIKFKLLDMGAYGLSDDLYMKMNARGVPLTDFENFKAWLTDQCSSISNDNEYFSTDHNPEEQKKRWSWKIDKEWTDLFWTISHHNLDDAFLRFFKSVALCAYAEKFSKDIEGKDSETTQYRKNISRLNNDEYIPVTKYKEPFGLVEPNTISAAFRLLDALHNGVETDQPARLLFHIRQSNEAHFELLPRLEKGPFTYYEQVLFYGYLLQLGAKTPDLGEFRQWIRIVRNLIFNSQIDSPQTFVRAIKGLKKLHNDKGECILNYLGNTPGLTIGGFRKEQVEEELQKAKLLCSMEAGSWYEEFQKYENLPLLRGQVGFLISFSNHELHTFQSNAMRFKSLFCNEIGELKSYAQFELQRALFAKENKEIKYQLYQSDDEWREYFRSAALPLKKLLEDRSDLEEIIKSLNCPENDWRQLIINTPELIGAGCKFIKIDPNNGNKVYLMNSDSYRGRHRELVTYYVWNKHIRNTTGAWYHDGRGRRETGVKCIDRYLKLLDQHPDIYTIRSSHPFPDSQQDENGTHELHIKINPEKNLLCEIKKIADTFNTCWINDAVLTTS